MKLFHSDLDSYDHSPLIVWYLSMQRGTKQQEGINQPNNHKIKKEELDTPMDSTKEQWSTNQQFSVTKLILNKIVPINQIQFFIFNLVSQKNTIDEFK